MDNELVGKGKHLIQLFKVTHESKMVEIEYHLLATDNELMSLNIEYQWLLIFF